MANDLWRLWPNLHVLISAAPAAPQPATQIYWLLGVVVGLLAIAYAVSVWLKGYPEGTLNPALVERFINRIRVWWIMCATLVAGFLLGRVATVVLFGAVSFWSLHEFVTATPTRRGDHRTLFWVFFGFTPLQFLLVGVSRDLYVLYSIVIPVYAFLFIPVRNAFAGDPRRFLERSAKVQAGLFICVYALSFAPALLNLPLTHSDKTPWGRDAPLAASGLLFYLILLTQLADVFQTAWSRLVGRHVIAPEISGTRTWEGYLGGVTSTTLIGALLWWATPFRFWEAACMSMIVAATAFGGNMVMSAIKRDRNVADFGTLVQGHPGVLDRIDSICFAAPVFYHLTRYFFSSLG